MRRIGRHLIPAVLTAVALAFVVISVVAVMHPAPQPGPDQPASPTQQH